MPKTNQSDPRKNFATRFLPWLLGGVMLLVYWCTLNHWVSLLNVSQVAAVSGWSWQPQIFNPLTYLVTLPFRLVPAAHVPVALNLFSSLCAALGLALLARSVAILPHDRTEMERTRERSDFSFLTGWIAWVPPIAAVVFAGCQLGFWEHATNFTGESFELLWFAIILWQLLEFRLDEREGRLYVAAVLYGAGIAETWAMMGYFLLFLTMIIWLQRLRFFDARFLSRMVLCGFGGLLLFLLLPALIRFSPNHPLTFWQALKPAFRADWLVLTGIKTQGVRHTLALLSLTSLLPAFFISIRWSASYGDSSRLGATMVNYLIHAVSAVIFGVLVWVMFDPPFSAERLVQGLGMNAPALTLNYVTALCIGYYCGYFLLVFGKAPQPGRRNVKPELALPKPLLWLCPVIVAGVLVALVAGIGLLLYKNVPIVRTANDDTLLKYARFSAENLPRDGAILLCDSDDAAQDSPIRSFLLQTLLAGDGRADKYVVVDTRALNWSPYHQYLHKRYPKIWPQTLTTNEISFGFVSPIRLFSMMADLSKSNQVCYLNPSFGYYFEQFYPEPHGLVYYLKPYPQDTFLQPPLDKNAISENGVFWDQVLQTCRPSISQALHPFDLTKLRGFMGTVMAHLHVLPEANPNALLVGTFYSRGLNAYGVESQRAGDTTQAATRFSQACEFNPDNVVAAKNLEFNKLLRSGSPSVGLVESVTPDQFGKFRSWSELLGANGLYDDSSFCFATGISFMQNQPLPLIKEALAEFVRVNQLAPDNLPSRLMIAQIYILSRKPDQALNILHDPLTRPLRFALTDYNSMELDLLAASAHLQKNEIPPAVKLMEQEIVRHPDDDLLLTTSAQSFMMRGLYTNALQVINHKLERSPNDTQWIYGKGFASLQTGDFTTAAAAFSRILQIQTNNPDALYNRACAYFQSDQLDAARADFRQLQTTFTNSFQIAYGLGEIAWRKHETNEAIRNYRIFLSNAPTNAAELKTIRERVQGATDK